MRKFLIISGLTLALLGAWIAPLVAQEGDLSVSVTVADLDILRLGDFDPLNPQRAPLILMMTIQNDDHKRNLIVKVDISGENFGFLGTARTVLQDVRPNAMVFLTNQDLVEYRFNNDASRLLDIALETGVLPVDEYQFEVIISDVEGNILARDKNSLMPTNPVSELTLIAPGNAFDQRPTEVQGQPLFQWYSEAQSFELTVYDVPEGVTSPEEVTQRRPIYQATEVTEQTLLYPDFAEELEAGQTYAWQVQAQIRTGDGAELVPSEVFWFRMPEAEDVPRHVTEAAVQPEEMTLEPGQSFPFTVSAFDQEGTPLQVNPTWKVIPETCGRIEAGGLFFAGETPTTCALVADYGRIQAYATLTIAAPEPTTPLITSPDDPTPETPTDPPDNQPETPDPTVQVLVPVPDQIVTTPALGFVWQAVDMADLSATIFRVRLWTLPADTEPEDAQGTDPIWQDQIRGALTMDFPLNLRDLDVTQRLMVQVEALGANGQILAQSDVVPFQISREEKIDWALYSAWDQAERDDTTADPLLLQAQLATATLGAQDRQQIEATGAQILLNDGPWLQLRTTYAQLAALSQLDVLQLIALPSVRKTNTATSPKITIERRPLATSVPSENALKVAILDFGFDVNPEEPAVGNQPVTVKSFREDGTIEGATSAEAEHGAAVVMAFREHMTTAEVHTLNFDTELEFLQALRYAVDTLQVKVISCSVSWFQAYGNFDGTSYFSQQIDTILGDDVVMVAAAGNLAQGHWEGTYEEETFTLNLRGGTRYDFLLSWDDWANVETDWDLTVLDANDRPLVDRRGWAYASKNRQGLTRFPQPVERIQGFVPPFPGVRPYKIRLTRVDETGQQPHMELYMDPPPEQADPAPTTSSSLAPGIAPTSSVVVVGAPTFDRASEGPTNDGRIAPDFVSTPTIIYKGTERIGTSFATPRVAAAFALIFEKHATWSAQQAIDFLKENGLVESAGPDNQQGWGAIDFTRLERALQNS